MKSLPLPSTNKGLRETLQLWQNILRQRDIQATSGGLSGSAGLANARAPKIPRIPFNFQAIGIGGGIRLTWAVSTDANGYQLLMSRTSDLGTNTIIFSIPVAGQNFYFDAAVPDEQRWYKIRAINSTTSGNTSYGSYSGIVTAVAQGQGMPSTPISYDTVTTDDDQVGRGIFLT